ncbi:MAG: DUF1501 domain-containing protein [Phycisphaeraceae bacterium]
MLNIFGRRHGYCDGVSRRSFIQAGAMGVGGLMLSDLLRAEAAAGVGSSNKSIINIFLGGGPPHTDMFDLKPNAPVEYRGEFSPIKTNVAGMEICEHMPKLATMADKFAVVRSIVGTVDDHSSFHTNSGFAQRDLKSVGGRPALGSVIAKMKGNTASGAPSFVSMMGDVSPGFLGAVHRPYRPDGPGRENLKLMRDMTAERLRDRTELRTHLDKLRKETDTSGEMNAIDAFTGRAYDVITSGELAKALDTSNEPKEVQDKYGREGRNFLLARRLVEAGVRTVTFNWGGWDTHSNNFTTLRRQLPQLDQGMSMLIQDLYDRAMLKDTIIVMWGEFGRTPRVNNNNGGRDHWSRVMQAFIAGGGLKTGQMIGTTDKHGGEADDRPVHLREVFATLYRHFGIDAKNTTLTDPQGRPQYLVDGRDPIKELI